MHEFLEFKPSSNLRPPFLSSFPFGVLIPKGSIFLEFINNYFESFLVRILLDLKIPFHGLNPFDV